jgi:naphthoate synthase
MANKVSELFDESIWQEVSGFEGLTDITYHQHVSLGIADASYEREENSDYKRRLA